jgi:hypothetical protein
MPTSDGPIDRHRSCLLKEVVFECWVEKDNGLVVVFYSGMV